MNDRGTLERMVAAAWGSRWLTVVFTLMFLGWAGLGTLVGLRELRDVDSQVRVHMHFVKTLTRDVMLSGRATLATVRESERKALLVGPVAIHVHCSDLASARIELEVEHREARFGDTLRIEDEATGNVHVIDELRSKRIFLRIPLPKANTTVRIVPSNPAIGMRVHSFVFEPGDANLTYGMRQEWETVFENDHATVLLGSGFWPVQEQARQPRLLESQRMAHLRIETREPGSHVLRLAFMRPDPAAPLPVIQSGGELLWSSVVDGNRYWSRVHSEDGFTEVELQLPLKDQNVLRIECPVAFRSPYEQGRSTDVRRVAYAIRLDRLDVQRVK